MHISKIFLVVLVFATASAVKADEPARPLFSWKPGFCGFAKDPKTHHALSCTCKKIGNFKIEYDVNLGACTIKENVAPPSPCGQSPKTIKIVPDSTLFVKAIEATPTSVSYLDVKKKKVETSFDWKANKWDVYYFDGGKRKLLKIDESKDPATVYDDNEDNAHTQILLFKKPKPRIVFQKRPNRLQDKPEETQDYRLVVSPSPKTGQDIELWYLKYPVPLARASVGATGAKGHGTGSVFWNQDEPGGDIQVQCDDDKPTAHQAAPASHDGNH